jgi:REP element-mobilizing transposase RayT
MEYEHDTHTVHLIVYHLIFCPKRRRKILGDPLRERLQQIIREVAADNKWSVIELAIQPDHVHVFMRSNPRTLPTAIDEAIRVTQFIRNTCLRLWMDTRGITKNDLQCYCAVLAKEFPFAACLNSQARQAAADRAWFRPVSTPESIWACKNFSLIAMATPSPTLVT